MVRYYLTQNIDNLEEQAGFAQKDMVQAHGANFGAVCAKCGADNDRKTLEEKVTAGEVMYCSKKEGCEGPIKPEITFFGEQLPEKFMEAMDDLKKTDLLIVIGTSLAVSPFNMCVFEVPEECPKVLINMENCAENGFEFDDPEKFPERLLLKGKSQQTVQEISEACSWKEELLERKKKADDIHDQKQRELEAKLAAEKEKVDDLAKQMGALDVEDKEGEGDADGEKPKDEEGEEEPKQDGDDKEGAAKEEGDKAKE